MGHLGLFTQALFLFYLIHETRMWAVCYQPFTLTRVSLQTVAQGWGRVALGLVRVEGATHCQHPSDTGAHGEAEGDEHRAAAASIGL